MEKSVENAPALVEKEDNPHLFNRILKFVSYPVAALAGLWVTEREVHEATYLNLKRYKAFDDILVKPETENEGLRPENEANVQARIKNEIDIPEFFRRSADTKTRYSTQVTECMEHMGF